MNASKCIGHLARNEIGRLMSWLVGANPGMMAVNLTEMSFVGIEFIWALSTYFVEGRRSKRLYQNYV
jgi:hypothetical protein